MSILWTCRSTNTSKVSKYTVCIKLSLFVSIKSKHLHTPGILLVDVSWGKIEVGVGWVWGILKKLPWNHGKVRFIIIWLATWADKMEPSCPLGTTCCILQEKFPQKPYSKSFIDQVCLVKMAGYWPHSFFASLWTSTSSRSINMQKRAWPISSHLDLTLGQ